MRYFCAININVEQKEKIMKTFKTLSIVSGLLLVASLASCKKADKAGVYSPKKKIQQIYYSTPYLDKTPFEHWEWNGDRLNSITHYADVDFKGVTWIENFTYEDNRITRVDNYTNSEYITYDYDGNHLKSATMFYRNAIACTWSISYDGDKINKMSGTFYDIYYKKDGATLHLNPLSHLLPPCICENIAKREQQLADQRHEEETFTLTFLLTWTDDNISKIVFTGDGEYIDFQLQYDDKNCPWYGLMGSLEDYYSNFLTGHSGFTKNNVTSMIVTEDHYTDTLRYAYQYDSDKYPILQTMFFTDNTDSKQVFYFEY